MKKVLFWIVIVALVCVGGCYFTADKTAPTGVQAPNPPAAIAPSNPLPSAPQATIAPLPSSQNKIDTTNQSGGANAIGGNASSSDSHNQTDSHNSGPTVTGTSASATSVNNTGATIGNQFNGNNSGTLTMSAVTKAKGSATTNSRIRKRARP